jgi:membrane protein involved in colicin uptake
MSEIERNLKLSDSVLRFLSVLVDNDIDPAAVRAELDAHRRRSAEARAAAEATRAAADAARGAAAEAARQEARSVTKQPSLGTEFEESEAAEVPDSPNLNGESDEQT